MSVRLDPKAEYPLIESHFICTYIHTITSIQLSYVTAHILAVYGPA